MPRICWMLRGLATPIIVICIANPSQAQQASRGAAAAEGKLSIVGNPAVTINPSCNNGSGRTWIKIRNIGPAGSKPVSLHPTATAVTGKSSAGSGEAMVKATVVAEPESDQAVSTPTLEAGKEAWIKIDVRGLNEPGDWETTLQNETVDVGPVKITRQELPFNVALDVANQDSPELAFEKGLPAHFGIKNNDNQDYKVAWEYDVDGWTVHSGDPQRPHGCCLCEKDLGSQSAGVAGGGTVVIPAKGFKDVVFFPSCKWFRHWFVGLFKDQVGDGRLVLSRVDDNACSAPGQKDSATAVKNPDPTIVTSKIFKIQTHLAAGSESGREAWTDLIVFFVLLLGGLISVILNIMLPNYRRRSAVDVKLADLDERISDLSARIASRLRVLAGLERRLLSERLKRLGWTNPNFAAELESIEKGVAQLEARVQILESLGATRDLFELRRAHNLRPSRIIAMEDTFDKIIVIAKKSAPTDSDVEKAKGLIAALSQEIEAGEKIDPDVASHLMEVAKQAQQDLSSTGPIGKTKMWQAISSQFCETTRVIDEAVEKDKAKKSLSDEDCLNLDRALLQFKLTKSFVEKVECLDDKSPLREQILSHKDDLLSLLSSDNGQALYLASRMLLQLMEGKCKPQIEAALRDNHLRIVKDHVLIYPYEACDFKLELMDPALDCATAREGWLCQWTFTHPQEPPLTEEGWEVTHYFKTPEIYGLEVVLTHRATDTRLPISDPRYQKQPHSQPAEAKPEAERSGASEAARGATAHPKNGEDKAEHAMHVQVYDSKVPLHTRLYNRRWDFLNFGLALFVVLVGMIAGAKDQLLKLSVVPALIAIFLAGFGADQIKNLLTKQGESGTKPGTS